MRPPFIGLTDSGEEYLVEMQMSGLGRPGKLFTRPLSELSAVERLEPSEIEPLSDPAPGPEGEILRLVLADNFLDGAGGGISLALRANIDFHPFQVRPLLKFHTTAGRRLLIADETGLGKTIEAGMIIAETVAANPGGTVVVLSPRSVLSKWIAELRRKFGIHAIEGRLHEFDGESPPEGVFVVSHGSMPSSDSIDIEDGALDLLVIDEVQLFIGRTDAQKRRGRAMCLSKASKGVLGMSATPIQIEMSDLQRILDLVAPGKHPAADYGDQVELQMALNRIMAAQLESESPDPADLQAIAPHLADDSPVSLNELRAPMDAEPWVPAHLHLQSIGPIGRRMTRARARDPDVDQAKERIVLDHMVGLGRHEALFHEIDGWLQRNGGRHPNRQQLASCPSAAVGIISHILGSNSPDDGSDWDDDYVAPAPASAELGELKSLKLRTEIEMPNVGPKLSELMELLEELESREEITKVVVFTHWIPTLRKASRVVRAMMDFPVYTISPDDDQEAIDRKIERLRSDDGFAVLFVSDRMSIGVDLEMANAAVNMDLPYNPAVLQQRIGRLDRIIQESDFIEIHNLILEGSVEVRIRQVIEERIEIFMGIIGGMEHIVEPDAPDPESDAQADEILARMRRRADVDMLARSDVLLRVMDSSLDGEIGERRRALHPLHARRHLIVAAAMERLGAQADWDEDPGVLRLMMPDATRSGILGSKTFFPWGADHVKAALESVDDDGMVSIPMRGRDAVIGPLHPFLSACASILMSSESMHPSGTAPQSDGLIGSSDSQPRWNWLEDGEREACDAGSLTLDLNNDSMRIAWELSERAQDSVKSAHGRVI